MNYEIAKQLKDAGFPLKNEKDWNMVECPYPWGMLKHPDGENYLYPQLSELIEACGDTSLIQITIGKAITTALHGESGIICQGSTPEEAVARLWLELNKK